MSVRRVAGFMLMFLFMLQSSALCAEPLLVLYMERPPYYYTSREGKPSGFLLEQALAVFASAGVPVRTRSLPAKRIVQMLKEEQLNAASVGWFMTEERRHWGVFSSVLYQDQPLVAVHRKGVLSGEGEEVALSDLLKDRTVVLGAIDGFSYGESVDESIRTYSPRQFMLAGDQLQLVKMLGAGRIDYILAAPEEVHYLLSQAGLREDEFDFTLLRDVPAGNSRYILFSSMVDSLIIQKVNDVLNENCPH
jgi:polar amino acid transport system substrate-binding protein